jgi:hypothetical protein
MEYQHGSFYFGDYSISGAVNYSMVGTFDIRA